MAWTHLFDLIAKLLTIAIAIGLIVVTDGTMGRDTFNWLIPVFFAIPALIWWLLLRPLSSWCYARFRLGVNLPFREAKRASILFSPVVNFTRWSPLLHLRTLDAPARMEALLDAVDEVCAYYEGRRQEWRAAPLRAKALRAAFWLSLPYLIGATNKAWWPFDWLALLEHKLFGGDYPLINVMVLWVSMALSLMAMEKDLGIRSIDMETQRKRDLAKRQAD